MSEFKHVSVLLNECIENLNIKPNGIYADGTLGGGGHSLEIVKKLTNGKLIAIDKDDAAIKAAKERLANYIEKIIFVKSDFKNLSGIMKEQEIPGFNGILLDLGVSSYQIDTPERGFSYRFDGPLDMRMDKSQTLSAYEVVNGYTLHELATIIREYGEDPFAGKIATAIVNNRPIETTMQLVKIIENCVPKKFQIGGSASKQTFQAIRIEVNNELGQLEEKIKEMARCLVKGGRMAVITFHSLEDRAVKNAFRQLGENCICDKQIPVCICNHKAEVKLISRKPILPTADELKNNKRSSSAKLRVVEKL